MTRKILSFLFFFSILSATECFSQSETEPNNKFDKCNVLTAGTAINGTINVANDSDIYCIQVTEKSVLNMFVDQVTGNAPMTMHVLAPDLSYLGVSSGSAGGTLDLDVMACNPGTYYFLIYETSKTRAGPTYRLNVSITGCDQYECNNSFSSATKISNSTPVSASIDRSFDEDYFEININQAELLTVAVNPVPSNISMDVVLFDNNHNQIAKKTSSYSGSPVSINKEVQAGKYFIRLRSQDLSRSASLYTLSLNHSVITGLPNENREGVKRIFPNPTRGDLFIEFSNQDVFRFRKLLIYDVKGKLVYSTDKLTGVNMFTLKSGTLPPGTYVLKLIDDKKTVVDKFIIAQ
jgi:hypothetical protein